MRKNRIYTIDFYRFIFILLICFLHFEYPYCGKQIYFICGYLAVDFYFILSGFLLSRNVLENDENNSISIMSVKFIVNKIKRYYIFYIYAYIVMLLYTWNSIGGMQSFRRDYQYGIWEVLLLQSAGFPNSFVNIPMWYFSALLIVSYFVYYIYISNKSLYANIVAPLSVILIYTFFARKYGNLDIWGVWNDLSIINNSLIRAFAGLNLGIMCNKLYNYLVYNNLNKLDVIILNLLEIISILGIISIVINNDHSNIDFVILPMFCIIIISSFLNVTYISKFLNRKVFKYLGVISFSIFANHKLILEIMINRFNGYNYFIAIIVYIILTIIYSVVTYLVLVKINDILRNLISKLKEKNYR